MKLKYMKVSLFVISYKKKELFHHIPFFFLDVPVDRHSEFVSTTHVRCDSLNRRESCQIDQD